MSDEPVTLREKYNRAMSSSHLEVSTLRQGAIDIIMAAGGAGMPEDRRDKPRAPNVSPVAALLLRLMSEYDEIRGVRAIARRNFEVADSKDAAKAHASDAVARETNRRNRLGKAPMSADELRACVVKAAEAQRDQMAHDARMAHAFVLMRLQSLASTKQAFGEWAMQMAERRRFMTVTPIAAATPAAEIPAATLAWRKGKQAQQTVVLALAGRVLDLLLDPNCYRCEGRGFNGGYDHSPQKICNDIRKGGCGGSGKRNTKIGKTKDEDDFAGYLMMEIDIMLGRVTREMNLRLRDGLAGLAMA